MIRRTFLRMLGLAPAAAVSCSQVASAQPEEGHWLPVGVVPDWDPESYVWAHYGDGGMDIECAKLSTWGEDPSYVGDWGIRFWSIPGHAPAPPVEEPTETAGYVELVGADRERLYYGQWKFDSSYASWSSAEIPFIPATLLPPRREAHLKPS